VLRIGNLSCASKKDGVGKNEKKTKYDDILSSKMQDRIIMYMHVTVGG
jgi:hypothetical protein